MVGAKKTTTTDHILTFLRDAPGLTTSELLQIPALRDKAVSAFLGSLRSRGVVRQENEGWYVIPVADSAPVIAARSVGTDGTVTDVLLAAVRDRPGLTARELGEADRRLHDKAVGAYLSGLRHRGRVRSDDQRPQRWFVVDTKGAASPSSVAAPAVAMVAASTTELPKLETGAPETVAASTTEQPKPEARPSATAHILALLRAEPDRKWSLSELTAAVAEAGSTNRPLASCLQRLHYESKIRAEGVGFAQRWFAAVSAPKSYAETVPEPPVSMPTNAAAVAAPASARAEAHAPAADDPIRDEVMPVADDAAMTGVPLSRLRTAVLDATCWRRGEMALTAEADEAFTTAVTSCLGTAEGEAYWLHFDRSGLAAEGVRDSHRAVIIAERGVVSILFLTPASYLLFLSTFDPRV